MGNWRWCNQSLRRRGSLVLCERSKGLFDSTAAMSNRWSACNGLASLGDSASDAVTVSKNPKSFAVVLLFRWSYGLRKA